MQLDIINAQFDPSDGTVAATALVADRISSTGTCRLAVTQGTISATAEATSVADASVSYCSGLRAQLPAGASGEWTVNMSFDDGAFFGESTTKVTAE